MSNWAALFVALAKPVLAKVLLALGMGMVTYVGLQGALTQIQGLIQTQLNGLIPEVAAILGLAGVGQAFGILCGAFAFRVSMTATKRLAAVTK